MEISFGLDKLPTSNVDDLHDRCLVDVLTAQLEHRSRNGESPLKFDVARIYGLGASECFLGRLIKNVGRSLCHVSTKVGLEYNKNTSIIRRTFDRDSLRFQLESSIDTLGTAPDRLYLHWPHPSDIEVTINAMKILEDLSREYNISELGICNLHAYRYMYSSGSVIDRIGEIGVRYLQDRINLFEWDERFWSPLKEKGFILVSHSSLCNGILAEDSILNPKSLEIPETLSHPNADEFVAQIRNIYAEIRGTSKRQGVDIKSLIWLSHQFLLGPYGEMCIGVSSDKHVLDAMSMATLEQDSADIRLLGPWKINGLRRKPPARF